MATLTPLITSTAVPTYSVGIAESNSWVPVPNDAGRTLFARATYPVNITQDGAEIIGFSKRSKDVVGRLKVSQSQNVYEADFEYGAQPLRWENLVTGNGIVTHVPQQGGVQMKIFGPGDTTIRQSRPYHRYQPGKTMYMASAVNFGGPAVGQVQRVGFFDDANGIFFEQGAPTALNAGYGGVQNGMSVVIRSDVGGLPIDTKIDFVNWSDPFGVKNTLDWTKLQMIWMEYAWYGAGCLRWGVVLNGEPVILHEAGQGNVNANAWCRTGNLPVRYEQRNITSNVNSTFTHYGVSVIVEGGRDPQRGFTYSYGMPSAVNVTATRTPILSIRNRTMGNIVADIPAGTSLSGISFVTQPQGPNGPVVLTLASNAYNISLSGLYIYFPSLSGAGYYNGTTARIYASSANSLTCVDVVAGLSSTASGQIPLPLSGISYYNPNTNTSTTLTPLISSPYKIGLLNRGQILPQDLLLSTTNAALFEFFVSTPANPITLTGGSGWKSLASLSSYNSFAEILTGASSFTGGEIVYSFFTSPGSNIQDKDLSNFFPLYNTIRGNAPDILTLAVTPQGGASASTIVGANIIGQEAMS
jgi:hypothetical protein